jgi:hypothetical protein
MVASAPYLPTAYVLLSFRLLVNKEKDVLILNPPVTEITPDKSRPRLDFEWWFFATSG